MMTFGNHIGYKHLWIGVGGAWITHVSAEDTIRQLRELDLCPVW